MNDPRTCPNNSRSTRPGLSAARQIGQEWPVLSPTVPMDGPRDQLLARSTFARDQNRHVGRGDQRDRLVKVLHGGRRSDQASNPAVRPVPVAPCRWGFAFSSARLSTAPAWSRPNGFTRYSKAPPSIARTTVSRLPKAVNDDDRRRTDSLSKPSQGRQAVHAGQTDVEHDGVDPAAIGDRKALFGGRRDAHVVPLVAEKLAKAQQMLASSSTIKILLIAFPRLPRWAWASSGESGFAHCFVSRRAHRRVRLRPAEPARGRDQPLRACW